MQVVAGEVYWATFFMEGIPCVSLCGVIPIGDMKCLILQQWELAENY